MGVADRFDEHRPVSAPASSASGQPAVPPIFNRLLLTGAAGGLGCELRRACAASPACWV